MRLLIFSDSHGISYYAKKVIDAHSEADRIVFLGDGVRDFSDLDDYIKNKPLTMVKGNCDLHSDLNAVEILNLAGYTLYITHGYAEHVKYGLEELKMIAKGYNANLVLFGHTHRQETLYEDGVHYFNPGSISERFYGIVDLTDKGIMVIEAKADY